jgi:hypothetical protein
VSCGLWLDTDSFRLDPFHSVLRSFLFTVSASESLPFADIEPMRTTCHTTLAYSLGPSKKLISLRIMEGLERMWASICLRSF